jgi:glycosyltransferase involved in cell wall biosynthesis
VLENYKAIEQVLAEGRDFVTYSERTKQRVLVDRFGVRPEQINVVRHAPMDLARHVSVLGYPNAANARKLRSESLVGLALEKSVIQLPVANADFSFIFYPTQFRPSKNVISLLRAYDHLVKTKFFGHKLVLTGNPKTNDDIMSFVTSHDLELDVLFLKDLNEAELAGCYHLASLAVNTSISEGGMPFTFTEALSVGTPVVMSDIEVTREIITDPVLADATLFDAYDWRAVAAKIEWGIEHRAELLTMQETFYKDVLLKRTWDNVVDEHLALLDAIGSRAAVS